jgi:hypothetical protein
MSAKSSRTSRDDPWARAASGVFISSYANPKIKKIKSYQSNYKESDFEALKSKAMDTKTTLGELEDLADYQVNSEIFSK